MNELSSQEVLKSQIATINDELQILAEKAALQFELFDESKIPDEPLGEVRMAEITDFGNSAGFWNHYIGGSIALAGMDMTRAESTGESVDGDMLRTLQARTIRETRVRLSGTGDLLDRVSCEAYLRVAGAFDWTNVEARNLFRGIEEAVTELGDCYMMLSGKRPL